METIRLPGLIDMHVHLRDPGQTHKEDFYTGTSAALAGGFTTVIDMPNNNEPITTIERLKTKVAEAKNKIVCNTGFYFGSLGDNLDLFKEAAAQTFGLKLYLNQTTGGYLLDAKNLQKIYKAWPQNSPILLHAEEDVITVVLESLKGLNRPIHVCHMPSRYILEKIIIAKKASLPVTCGVTPHHLFLNEGDVKRLGVYGQMKPSLKPQSDVDFLWAHIDYIDAIESDHAPHTKAEKQKGAYGVPGLETTLPLLLQAEREGRISKERIIQMCSVRPTEILGIVQEKNTFIEVEPIEYQIDEAKLLTKCGWSPFTGLKVFGKVQSVFIHGKKVFEREKVLAKPGSGKVLAHEV
jgi:dihydroorotase